MTDRSEPEAERREQAERYLVDREGPADPEVERLEGLLGRYRLRPEPLRLPDDPPAAERPGFLVPPRAIQVALAAAAGFVALLLVLRGLTPAGDGYVVRGLAGVEHLARGRWLETGAERAWIEVGEIGEVRLEPGARVRLDDDGREESSLYLERGSLHATILAAPGAFQIDTPAGLSIDLGCLYRLEVDDDDVSHLEVEAGQVAFEAAGAKVFVPQGYATFARPGRGPVAPLAILVDPDVERLVRRVERAADASAADVRSVGELDDAVVLYHLLRAPASAVREAALEALLRTEELPEGLTREDVLSDEASWLAWHDELSWRPIWRR
ncbi:MAG: FecR domain-containing protein [Planctomycetota bacterium]